MFGNALGKAAVGEIAISLSSRESHHQGRDCELFLDNGEVISDFRAKHNEQVGPQRTKVLSPIVVVVVAVIAQTK